MPVEKKDQRAVTVEWHRMVRELNRTKDAVQTLSDCLDEICKILEELGVKEPGP